MKEEASTPAATNHAAAQCTEIDLEDRVRPRLIPVTLPLVSIEKKSLTTFVECPAECGNDAGA